MAEAYKARIHRENEFLLGVGETIVGHGVHPEYGMPTLTFTKAIRKSTPGSDVSPTELASIDEMNTVVLVFQTEDALKQHLARLELAVRGAADKMWPPDNTG